MLSTCALEHVRFFHVLAPYRLLCNRVIWGLVTVNAVLVIFLLLLFVEYFCFPQTGTMAGFTRDNACDDLVSRTNTSIGQLIHALTWITEL